MIREIILDTETTGLDPKTDRLVEIGCLELVNRYPTGREFHTYLNPERDVSEHATKIHGLTTSFLIDKPSFGSIASEFITFIAHDPLIIHNAPFDVGFLNAELARGSFQPLEMTRVTCSLQLARRKHPAGPNSLDALCKRYQIDATKRTKHGALLDCQLLADVYVELLGIRQAAFDMPMTASDEDTHHHATAAQRPYPLSSRLSEEDEAAHLEFIKTLGEKALWLRA